MGAARGLPSAPHPLNLALPHHAVRMALRKVAGGLPAALGVAGLSLLETPLLVFMALLSPVYGFSTYTSDCSFS